jgi:hypothetical protein
LTLVKKCGVWYFAHRRQSSYLPDRDHHTFYTLRQSIEPALSTYINYIATEKSDCVSKKGTLAIMGDVSSQVSAQRSWTLLPQHQHNTSFAIITLQGFYIINVGSPPK